MTYTIGSLFSGYGGLDLAVERALGPARTAWVSDIEPGPCKILAARYPGAPNLGDITEIDWTQVEPVDVIAGGSPCQDLSMAGRRAGMKPGTRSGLWESMFHAIRTIRPHLVVWENVRGAFSAGAFSLMESREGRVGDGAGGPVLRALGRVLGDLASIGYDAQWVGLRASDVGAPHQRYRVFVAAHPQGDTWWLQHRDRGDVADAHGDTLRVESIDVGGGRSAPESGGAGQALPDPACNRRGEGGTQSAREQGRPDAASHCLPAASDTQKGQQREQTVRGVWAESGRSDCFTPADSDDERLEGWWASSERPDELPLGEGDLGLAGGVVPASWGCPFCGGLDPDCEHCNINLRVGHSWGRFEPAIRRWELILGREAPSAVIFGPHGKLQLSPYFDEWVMGLDAGWICDLYDHDELSRNDVLRLCGNGVVPQQAAAAIRLMRDREVEILRSEVAA